MQCSKYLEANLTLAEGLSGPAQAGDSDAMLDALQTVVSMATPTLATVRAEILMAAEASQLRPLGASIIGFDCAEGAPHVTTQTLGGDRGIRTEAVVMGIVDDAS